MVTYRNCAHLFVAYLVALWSCAGAASTFLESVAPRGLSNEEIAKIQGTREGDVIFSGDLIYYTDVLLKSGVVANIWPRGEVYFEFDGALSQIQKDAFLEACQAWSVNSPIRCIPRSGQLKFIRVANHNGEKCQQRHNVSCSAIGMQTRNPPGQDLYIYSSHWTIQSVIRHEIGHAIGMIHEQQRPDRDNYVFIRLANISPGAESNFDIWGVATATEYDFDSIMHYSNCAFSIGNCNSAQPVESTSTIFPKECNRDKVGGEVITPLDYEGVRVAYMPQLQGLYKKSRTAECGVHDLSAKQVKLMCGSQGCAEASAVTYNKVEEFHADDCGGFVVNPRMTCPVKKTFLGSRYEQDDFSCGWGGLQTSHDWWWSCGCEKQSLPASCSTYKGDVDLAVLSKLRESQDVRDQAIARYIDLLFAWQKMGYVQTETSQSIGKLLIRNYLQEEFRERLFSLLCDMRVVIELSLYASSRYQLKHATFLKMAAGSGITVDGS